MTRQAESRSNNTFLYKLYMVLKARYKGKVVFSVFRPSLIYEWEIVCNWNYNYDSGKYYTLALSVKITSNDNNRVIEAQ